MLETTRHATEHLADPLDVANRVAQAHTDDRIALYSRLAAPEQEMNPDGSPTETECRECGTDLGERAYLGRVLCIRCQEILERKRRGLFRGQ